VQAVNAQGGLNCHPIKYVIADDGGDPSKNQALVAQLVEQDHVIAFVQMDAPLAGQASISYLEQKQIPVIGTETGSPWAYTSPMYFPQASSDLNLITSAFGAAGSIARPEGRTKVGTISCIEAPICSNLYNQASGDAARFGLSVVYRGRVSLAQPDFTANCQAAQSAGVQVFLTALDANSMERVTRSCGGVNFHPMYALYTFSLNPTVVADPQLDRAALGTTVIPFTVSSNPSIANYLSILKRYAPGLPPDSMSVTGWVSAQLFQLAAANLPDSPTSQDILNGLWAVKGNDLGGITQPLTFNRGQTAPQAVCYWVLQLTNGHFVSPNNGVRSCL
jgi:branched-chain amino acid transport system substrate-binding protein